MPRPRDSDEKVDHRPTSRTAARRKKERRKKPKVGAGRTLPDVVTEEAVREECLRAEAGYDPDKSKQRGDWFSARAAASAINTVQRRMVHVKGPLAGQAFRLMSWQRWLIGNLFGWKRQDGTRRYRRAFIFVPRKNGKTPIAAAIITLLLLEDDQVGDIYGGASTQRQAKLVWHWVRGFVAADPDWSQNCQVYRASGQESIQRTDNFSAYNVVASDHDSAHGWNAIGAVADELHTWDDRGLLLRMIEATAVQEEPMVVEITTADYERHSVCNEEYDYACKVRDGTIEDREFLPAVYEAPRDMDWTAEATWRLANPSLGESVKLEYIEAACKRAQEVPVLENDFRRFHLNQRTQQQTRAIQMDVWRSCGEAFSEEQLAGRRCFGGLDLASRNDLACWLLLFPPTSDDEKWRVLPRFFVPEVNAIEREKKDGVPYVMWARDGHLTLTPGNVIDYAFIRQRIEDDAQRFDILRIGGDMWNLLHLQQELGEVGARIHGVSQNFRGMSEPTKELLQVLIPSGKLAHARHPVMDWCADNVVVRHDPSGNLRPIKEEGKLKIDGIVALICALAVGMVTAEPQPSVYESRGVIAI